MSNPTKPKAPRRSDTAIAADYARKAEAARVRPIKATAKYIALKAANDALHGVEDGWCDADTYEAVNEASRVLALELNRMLAVQGKEGA